MTLQPGPAATPECAIQPSGRPVVNFLQGPYTAPLPEAFIRRIAQHWLREVNTRNDDAFW